MQAEVSTNMNPNKSLKEIQQSEKLRGHTALKKWSKNQEELIMALGQEV